MESNELVDEFESQEDKIIERMSTVTGVKYSDEQLKILKSRGGLCILAAAGSGKTTVLNHLIAKRIQTGEIGDPSKLLCTTFSKGGATEMDERQESLLAKLGVRSKVKVKTLHSIYLGLLKDLGYNLTIIDGGTKMRYIREACKESEIILEDKEFQTLDGIFGYQINNLMSDEALFKSYAYTLREKIPLEKYSHIRASYNNKKQQNNCMDFDDMQLFVYTLLKSDNFGVQIQRYCQEQWQYFYVDEAQDVSRIQFEILKMFISDPNKLVVIGDDDQCIYQWRGADPSIILNICGVYTELMMYTLTTNYRCLGDIVDRAAHAIEFNSIRSKKTMKAFKPGGNIRICDIGSGNIYENSKFAYKYVKELVIDKGVKPSDIAIMSRNNQHLTVLSNMLFKDGIYCKSTDDMKFTKCSIYKMVEGILKLGQNTTNGNITAANLWKCCMFMNRAASKEFGNIQGTFGLCLRDLLGLMLTAYGHNSSIQWTNPGIKIGMFDASKYEMFMARLNSEAINSLEIIYETLSMDSPTKATITLLSMFLSSKLGLFFKSDDSSRFAAGYIDYLSSMIEDMGINGFNRYIKEVEQYESGGLAIISPMIELTTIHGAKGKEWKYVIIFADDNISFPSFQSIQECIESGVPDTDIRSMLDENRRLHYVAMTRAKEHLTIFMDKKNPSIYALEAFDIVDPNTDSNSNIILMSQHGIYTDLVEKAGQCLFSNDSPYYMGVDVKSLKTETEVSYDLLKDEDGAVSELGALGVVTSSLSGDSGFNINSIQTLAPFSLTDTD